MPAIETACGFRSDRTDDAPYEASAKQGRDQIEIYSLHHVFLLERETDRTRRYVGFSDDLKRRLLDHNNGKSQFTQRGRPSRLVTSVAFREREKALAFERYLKVGSGHAFARRHFWN